VSFHRHTLGVSSLADIYIAAVSASHNVAAKDVWIAEVSTIVETSVPEREILPGLQLLGTVVDKYVPPDLPYTTPADNQIHLHHPTLRPNIPRNR